MKRVTVSGSLAAAGAAVLLAGAGAAPPPTPTIESAPPDPSRSAEATFAFAAPGAVAFQCRLDDGDVVRCRSPISYSGLADGSHVFRVRAVGADGEPGPVARYGWTVDLLPVVSITAGPSGAVDQTAATFAFDAAGAPTQCALDGEHFSSCRSPTELVGLADGEHTFRVRALDGDGTPGPAAARTWRVDTVAPALTITGGPEAVVRVQTAVLTFSTSEPATATCRVDDAAPAPCSSPVRHAGLGEGRHTFEVRAADDAGNVATASRSWRIDLTAPELRLPGPAVVEADRPAGANVSFSVAATDLGSPLLPSAVACTPRSGSVFPLGRTAVGCVATDAAGNAGTGSFPVTVRDTTPPVINAPDVSLEATGPYGIRREDRALVAYLAAVSARDLVSAVTVSVDHPATLPVGRSTLTVTARDASGNTATRRPTVTVVRGGSAVASVDVRPPPPVRRARADAGDHQVRLSWITPARDVARVEVRSTRAGEPGPGRVLFRGRTDGVVVRRLRNGVRHRFVITTVDDAGNRSQAVVLSATPTARLLARPRPGQIVRERPLFRWAPVSGATYFNVQLFRGRTKVLSAWPSFARLVLPGRWRYEGRVWQLEPGVYTWYVWPGLGDRARARYGPLLGKATFRVVGGLD